jgi:hypothetical protein
MAGGAGMSWRSRCWPRPKGKADWKHYSCGPHWIHGNPNKGEDGEWHVNPFVRAVGDVDKLTALVADAWNAKRGKPRWNLPKMLGSYYCHTEYYACRHKPMPLVKMRDAISFERGRGDRRLWGQYVGLAKWIHIRGSGLDYEYITTWESNKEAAWRRCQENRSIIYGDINTIWKEGFDWRDTRYGRLEIGLHYIFG